MTLFDLPRRPPSRFPGLKRCIQGWLRRRVAAQPTVSRVAECGRQELPAWMRDPFVHPDIAAMSLRLQADLPPTRFPDRA